MADNNKTLVEQAIEKGWNQRDYEAVGEFYDPDFVFEEEGGEMRGIASVKEWIEQTHAGFPDLHYTIEAMYAEGDTVATRYTARGTHMGNFRGMPPTGKAFELTGHMIHRLSGGRIFRGWGSWDTVGLLQQLGVVPPIHLGGGPPTAKADPVASLRRLFEALSSPDSAVLVQAIDELMVPGFVTHGDALFPLAFGREALERAIPAFKRAFPDATVTIQQIVADGDKVMAHVVVTGTHEDEWMGVAPTHRRMTWTATSITRFNDEGKMAERWVIEDQLGMLQQLGRVAPIEGQGIPHPQEAVLR